MIACNKFQLRQIVYFSLVGESVESANRSNFFVIAISLVSRVTKNDTNKYINRLMIR